MASDLHLRGVYVPIVTPFDESGGVATDAVERLCHDYLEAGAAGIVALGTTGESAALDHDERHAVIDACCRACAEHGAPVIAGAGTNSTRVTVGMVEGLTGLPALSAALVVVPYYVRPSIEGIVGHFETVAAASPVPLVIYNIPYRTGRVLDAEALLRLAHTPNIAAVKQAVGGVDSDTLEVLAAAPDGFHVLAGDDPYIYPVTLMGGAGAVAASAHTCTTQFVSMVDCGLAGKVEEGRRLAVALLPVVKALFAEPNPAVTKGVLHAQGRIPTPDLRAPMTNASSQAVDRALAAIDAVER